MTALKLTAFTGEKPRILPRLLPDTAAQSALDVRLDDGALTPMRRPVQAVTLDAAGKQTIYRFGDEWLSWPGPVNAAPGPVADDRLYFTGDGAPKIRVDGTTLPLAVPMPAAAPVAAVSGTATEGAALVTRVYAYTWVTAYGEESEPSAPSGPIDWTPGQTLTLSGFSAVPAGRQITRMRIYRSQTGQSGTGLFFIAERDASSGDFIDTVAVDDFNEEIPSTDWNAPPDTLAGLIPMPNGMMAAFDGRKVYFCEPYHPHAWPEKYVLTVDYDIVGLGALGTSLIIMTEGNPYLAAGASPDTMQMVKLESNLPCINARGIVDLGFAVCYPSVEGLVAARADGTIAVVTSDLFDRDSWLALSPSTFVCGQMAGRYVAFFDTIDAKARIVAGALFIDVGAAPFLIRTAERASAVFYDLRDTGLYYQKRGSKDVLRLDAPSGARATMYWKSKPFVMPWAINLGAILIDSTDTYTPAEDENFATLLEQIQADNAAAIAAGSVGGDVGSDALNAVPLGGDALLPVPTPPPGGVSVGVYADGRRVATVNRIGSPVRLPSGFTARTWEIDVTGDIKVDQIAVGQTMDDLRTIAP